MGWRSRGNSHRQSEETRTQGAPFMVHRYGPGRGCAAKLPHSSTAILGRMPDGHWEIEVITYQRTNAGVEVLLRNGSLLHSEVIGDREARKVGDATGFKYPKGGVCVVVIRGGELVDAYSKTKPMEHT